MTGKSTAAAHRQVVGFALPVILANLTQPLLSCVDTAIAGHFADGAVLGGVALGGLIFNILFWSFGFLRMTTTGLTAQAWGAHDALAAWLVLRRSLLIAGVIGAVILAVHPILIRGALLLLGGSVDVRHDALLYCASRIWSAPATLINYVVLGTLLGQRRATLALALQAAINLVNMAAAFLLVYGPMHLGVAGLGAATAIADGTGAVLGLLILWRPAPGAVPRAEFFDLAALKGLLLVNRDMFIRTACLLAAFAWFARMGAAEGDTILAANAVLLNFQTFMAYGLDGFANAAEALVGTALGARDRQAYNAAVAVSTFWAALTALGFSLAYLLFGPAIIDVLTDSADIRRTARDYLPWTLISPLVSVWGFQLDGIFIGATRSRDLRNAMLVSLAGFLALAVPLQRGWGNAGLWTALLGFMALRGLSLCCLLPRISRSLDRR